MVLHLRAYLQGGWGPQEGEVTRGGSPHLLCKHNQIKMRDYMDRRVNPPKRGTSSTWGPPPPCKQALTYCKDNIGFKNVGFSGEKEMNEPRGYSSLKARLPFELNNNHKHNNEQLSLLTRHSRALGNPSILGIFYLGTWY